MRLEACLGREGGLTMKRFWVRAVTGCFGVAAVSALTIACAHNDQTLFIQGVMPPPAVQTGGVCSYTSSLTAAFLSSGQFDVGLGASYPITLQLGNQLLARGTGVASDPTHAESSRISLQGADVTITTPDGKQVQRADGSASSFETLGSAFVDVGSGGTPGLGILGVTGIDQGTTKALCGQLTDPGQRIDLVLNIKAFGKTLGGTDVESQNFTFPVSVCKGCLVDRSDGCTTTAMAMGTAPSKPCSPGADVPITCSSCAASLPSICAPVTKLVPGMFNPACGAE
jgi:hypothetical protein